MAVVFVGTRQDQLCSLGRLVDESGQLPQPPQTAKPLHSHEDLMRNSFGDQRQCFCIANICHQQQHRTPLVAHVPRHEPQPHI